MIWGNQIRRSMEYRYSVKAWRVGEPKSKSGYRTIPLTEEAVAILNKQKEKNKRISEISNEWEEFVFLCRKGTPVKTVHMIQYCLRFVIRQKFLDFQCIF